MTSKPMKTEEVTKMEWKEKLRTEIQKTLYEYIKTKKTDEMLADCYVELTDLFITLFTLSESRVRGEEKLALAEAQLLGFDYGRWHRTDLEGLIESMGLTKKEWNLLNKNYDMTYLTDEDRREILTSLTKKEGEE